MAARATASPATTKRITLSVSGDGGTGTFNGFTDYAQRLRVALPVTPTRWRLRIRNARIIPFSAQTGVLTFQPVYLGTPSYPTGGIWAAATTATMTQVLPSFTTDSAGAEYTSSWVTDGGTYFTPGVEKVLSFGWTTTGTSVNLANGTLGGKSFWDTGASAAVANTTGAGSSASNTFLDIRLEYEYADTQNRPTVLAVGDSITAGYEGQPEGTGVAPHETWIGQACMRKGIPWVNIGVSGSSTGNWTTSTDWAWTRCDLTTTVPDVAVVSLGTNDYLGAVSLTTYKANVGSIVTILRNLGIPRIFLTTCIPTSQTTNEATRLSYNTFVQTLPWGVDGCFEFAKAIEIQGTAATPDSDYVTTTPHPQKRGYQRMAAAVNI